MGEHFTGRTLPEQFADRLERDFAAGERAGRLPGYRTLMLRYGTSAKTTRAALRLLAARGLLTAPPPGRSRAPVPDAAPGTAAPPTLLMLHDLALSGGEDFAQLRAYRAAWEARGGRVETLARDFPRRRNPGALLRDAVARHRADAILLHVAPRPWVTAAMRLRPVFLSGGEYPREGVTGVGYHLGAEVTRAVAGLAALGHRRVMIATDHAGAGMIAALRLALAAGLALDPADPLPERLCRVFPDSHPAAWHARWGAAFADTRATAVILFHDTHLLSLLGHCRERGLSIPRDLAVLCMESTPHLDWCVPAPTRMRFPVAAAARRLGAWFKSGLRPLGMRILPLESVPGASLAPPATAD